jgi:aryl-alcohol dehydrogenase-like predicted oxidoreductase
MAPPSKLTKDQILAAAAASCRRLQTEYIDLYYLHWPARYVPTWGKHKFDPKQVHDSDDPTMEEQIRAIGELLANGTIKAWGLSNETAYGVVVMCETAKQLGVPLPCCVQNDYSLHERYACLPCLPFVSPLLQSSCIPGDMVSQRRGGKRGA